MLANFSTAASLLTKDCCCFPKPATLANPEIKPTYDYTGPSKEETLALRKQFLSPALVLYYQKPVMIVEGKQQYLFDENKKRYLDCIAGIVTVSVGHSHPAIVKAAKEQTEKLIHTTPIYLNNEIAEYGKELAAKFPENLRNIYFVNSGSEATELAMMMARQHTGNVDIIALRNAYHGGSSGSNLTVGVNTWKFSKTINIGVQHALNPDGFRGPFKYADPDHAAKYAWDVKNLIECGTCGRVAAWISETIQGVGGSVEMPDGYLNRVYDIVHAAGGICIADEVQTGFGRTGTHYWGFQTKGVTPDIVTMAKGIGNGFPLAAVATSDKIAKSMLEKTHFNTFGGNPVSSAVGRAVLRVIDEEGLQQNSLEVGNYLIAGLKKLQKKHDIIGDVRGKGLMLGMELVKDKKTLEPATQETLRIFEKAKDMGVLLGKGGLYGNVFRIKPPMCFNKDNADEVLYTLDKCMAEL